MESEGPGPLLRAGVLISACVLILSAPLAGLYGLKELLSEAAPLAWPETTGTITKTMIEQSREPENPKFRPRVFYDYTVHGETYSGDRVFLEDRVFASAEAAIEAKKPFNAGGQPTVYYDPHNPAESLLVRGTRTSSWLWLLSPFALAGVGALLLWGWLVVRRDRRKKKVPSEFDI